jgi:hypothetical protein
MPERSADVRVHSATDVGVLQTPGVLLLFPVLYRSASVANLQRALSGVPPVFRVYLGENVYYFLNVSNKHIVDSTPYYSYSKRISAYLLHFRC